MSLNFFPIFQVHRMVNYLSKFSSEALPALSYFQSRQVKPMAWKCKLEIGQMEIPINGYSKVTFDLLKIIRQAEYIRIKLLLLKVDCFGFFFYWANNFTV